MDFKVYILLEAPVLEKTYEIFAPIDRRIYELIAILQKTIPELSEGYYKNKKLTLFNKSTGRIYDLNVVIKDSDIKMGTRLVIV